MTLIGRQYLGTTVGLVQTPRLAVAYVFIQFQGLVLGQDTHGINSRVYTVGKWKVNYAIFSSKRNGGFCRLLCQVVKARALTTRKKHRNAFFLEIHE